MKIDINEQDLFGIRDLICHGRDYYRRSSPGYLYRDKQEALAAKLIRKVNAAFKVVYGHDCQGEAYL